MKINDFVKVKKIKYTKPNFSMEWEEAKRYSYLEKLGIDEWIKLAKKGKPIIVNKTNIKNIGNTTALGGSEELRNLDKDKVSRFKTAMKSGIVEMPIVVKQPDSTYDLLAGNTRLTGLISKFGQAKIWFIDASHLKNNSLELTEATNVNVTIINDIIDQIFNMLPYEIGLSDGDKTILVRGENLDLDDLKKKFPRFEEFFDHIKQTKFFFVNAPKYENSTTMGLYNSDTNTVVINLSNTMEYYGTHETNRIMRKTRTNSPYAVLFHEIRHIMQHKDYPDHFASDKDHQKEYKERDIEIDAAWYNIIAVHDPKKFKPKAYAHRVMDDLSHYRNLSDRQKNHYYKKTLKYYTNPELFDQPPQSKEEILINRVAKKVLQYLEKAKTYDLRNLPNYDSDNFLFPIEKVIGSVRSALTFHTTVTMMIKNMLYFVPSLYLPKSMAKVWKQYVKKIHQYDLDDALRNFETGMPPNHFDYDAMKTHMEQFYS